METSIKQLSKDVKYIYTKNQQHIKRRLYMHIYSYMYMLLVFLRTYTA